MAYRIYGSIRSLTGRKYVSTCPRHLLGRVRHQTFPNTSTCRCYNAVSTARPDQIYIHVPTPISIDWAMRRPIREFAWFVSVLCIIIACYYKNGTCKSWLVSDRLSSRPNVGLLLELGGDSNRRHFHTAPPRRLYSGFKESKC